MLQAFRHAVEDTPLFCRACQGIYLHTLRAQEPLRAGHPAHPKEPILISCHHCQQSQVFVADEFRDFSVAPAEHTVFKIAGRSRIQVKDDVYIPGQPCTGTVKSRFRVGNQECFIITNSTGDELRWTPPPQQAYGEYALESYRLLPVSVGQTRIGDAIFHTSREKFGRAVGLVFGKDSKLVVQLEDEAILLLSLPAQRQIPENRSLTAQTLEVLGHKCPEALAGVHFEAGQGILYARGTCSSLQNALRLRHELDEIHAARGSVVILSVQPEQHIADEILVSQVENLQLSAVLPLFGVQVTSIQGVVRLEGFCRQEGVKSTLSRLIAELPGICGLQIDLLLRPQEDPGDREKAQIVAQALRRNATLKDARIRIYMQQGTIHLEGIVRSSLQRNAAGLAAMWAGRNFRVENKIRIVKNIASEPSFIKVA